MFVTNLLVLNTLIAILGDSYDNVMSEKATYDMKQKIQLLLELNVIYFFNKNKEDCGLFVCFLLVETASEDMLFRKQSSSTSNGHRKKINIICFKNI